MSINNLNEYLELDASEINDCDNGKVKSKTINSDENNFIIQKASRNLCYPDRGRLCDTLNKAITKSGIDNDSNDLKITIRGVLSRFVLQLSQHDI